MAPADERPALRAKYGTSAVFAVHAVLQRLHTRKGKQELVDDGLLEAAEAVLPLDRAVRRKLERKTLEFVDYQASYAANSTGRGYGPGTVTHRPSAFKDASAAPRRLLTAARLDALLRDGIVWVDGALGGPAVGRAARELAEMKGGGGMFGHENVNRQLCNPVSLVGVVGPRRRSLVATRGAEVRWRCRSRTGAESPKFGGVVGAGTTGAAFRSPPPAY